MRRIDTRAFRIARRGTSREINRQIALNLVRERQPLSRADLARLMGLRAGSVGLIVNELLHSGLVFEGDKGESKGRGGRKPTHLYLETRARCAVAVDVNASRTFLALTDLFGRPLVEIVELKARRRPQALVAELAQQIASLRGGHRELGQCVGIGDRKSVV